MKVEIIPDPILREVCVVCVACAEELEVIEVHGNEVADQMSIHVNPHQCNPELLPPTG